MQKERYSEAKKCSSQLMTMIKTEEFPKYHMPNTGKNYTGGREDNAWEKFNIFLGSCAYAVCFADNFIKENQYVG